MANDQTNWHTTAQAKITDTFVGEICTQFDCAEFEPVLRNALCEVAAYYVRDLSAFRDDQPEQRKRAAYQSLAKETARFKAVLIAPDYADLATDLHWAARHRNEHPFEGSIPVIGAAKDKSGEAYLIELERLLALVQTTAQLGIDRFAPVRGRKRKVALENLVRRLADIWANTLERPFTVDYHAGTGLTEAFRFVSLTTTQLDGTYNDTELITAMRTIITERGQ